MVFESVLADVLNRYLKPYIKKLDNSQLKVGVWKGNVSLDKLELKEDLFDDFDLPLKVVRSYIGGIHMSIPWKQLGKDPIIIGIDEVYVILSPYFDQPYDPVKDAARKKKVKDEQIKKIKEAAKNLKKKKSVKNKKEAEVTEKPDTFVEKLASHLVKNLQVKVRDVHVRYEDSITNPGTILAAGACLSCLELKSVDANWIPCMIKETATLIYKLVELNSVSIYWSTLAQKLSELPGDSWMDSMRNQIPRAGLDPPAVNEYLLYPMTASAKVKLNLKPGQVMDIPQVYGRFECDEISLSVSEEQFKSLMFTLDSFNRHNLNLQYLKYKPLVPVTKDKRAWWMYAYNAVLEKDVKGRIWSWAHMKEHRTKCRNYIKKYQEKLSGHDVSKELERMEVDLDVFNIMLCRKAAKRKGKTKKSQVAPTAPVTAKIPEASPGPPAVASSAVPRQQVQEKKKSSFWSSMFKKSSKKPDKTVSTTSSKAEASPPPPAVSETLGETSEEDRMELYKFIGYSEDEEYIEFPREYVAHNVEVSVGKITVELSGKRQKLATVMTHNVSVVVLNRPSSKSLNVNACVGSIHMTGIPVGSQPTNIVTSVYDDSSLVTFDLQINPLDRPEKDLIIAAARVQPMKITYDENTIDKLIGAFRVRKNIHLQELTSAASSTVDQLRARTSAGLQEALRNRKQLELDVVIHSPYILIPDKGHYTGNNHLIVIDLGVLSLTGKTQDPQVLYKELTSKQTMSSYYDTFNIKLSALQVLVAKPGQDWETARQTQSSSFHILCPTGFSLELKKSVVSDDALLPSLQMIGDISGFHVHLNDDQLLTLLLVVTSLKLPPPSLKNTTTYYNELPPPPTQRFAPDHVPQELAKSVSMDTVFSYGDDDTISFASSTVDNNDESESSQFVFTDVKMMFVIKEIELSLSQLDKEGRELPMLSLHVNTTFAEVNDRNWDLQAKISVHSIVLYDYITKNAQNEPSYLLKTDPLSDGNFLTAHIVSVTQVGQEFASKYSGLENTISIKMALVQINIHHETLSALMTLGSSFKPILDSNKPPPSVTQSLVPSPNPSTNLEPNAAVVTATPKEFNISASFRGINLLLLVNGEDIVQANVTGLSVLAELKARQKTITASITDLMVSNPIPGTTVPHIVHKSDNEKDLLKLKVTLFPNATKGSGKYDVDKVDALISGNVQKLVVNLNAEFVANVLDFVERFKLDSEHLIMAFTATANTANATASAMKENTSFRMLLSFSVQAPYIIIPYYTKNTTGSIHIELGDFVISNRLLYGHQVMDNKGSVCHIKPSQAILDRIEITTSSIHLYRETSVLGQSKDLSIRSDILDPVQFSVIITRNVFFNENKSFPKVTVKMAIEDEIKFYVSDEDIQALISIAQRTASIGNIISSKKGSKLSKMRGLSKTKSDITKRTNTIPMTDLDHVIQLKLEANLKSISLDLSKGEHSIIKGTSKELTAAVKLTPKNVCVSANVGELSIVDLAADTKSLHKQILTFSKIWQKEAITLEVEAPLKPSLSDDITPKAIIRLNVAQFQLLVTSSLIKRLLNLALSININPQLVKSATKKAQDGAIAANEMVQGVYVKLSIHVNAPNVLLPIDDATAFMLDLGRLELDNKATTLDENLIIDTFGLVIRNFKVSRVLLSQEKLSVLTERVIVPPYSMILNIERNLCPWNTAHPLVFVDLHMGVFTVILGQEDIQAAVKFGLSLAQDVAPILKKKFSGEIAGAVVEGLIEQGNEESLPPQAVVEQNSTSEKLKKAIVKVSLAEFHAKVYQDEPKLIKCTEEIQTLPDENGLTSFQLIGAELIATIYTNSDVDVSAAIKDLSWLDIQAESKNKNTGNRILQHYTSNPLNAFAGKCDEDLLNINYSLVSKEHYVTLKAANILLLSDIGFIQKIAEYVKVLVEDIQPLNKDDSLEISASVASSPSPEKKMKLPQLTNVPLVKVTITVKDIRVAVIEDVESTQPQALVLKVSVFCQLKLDPENNSKQATINVSDLGATTCLFYNLDNATSAVLLPFSILIMMSGPLDNLSAMNINGTFDPICLRLSPAVIRLIIHAVKTLSLTSKKPEVPLAPSDLWQKKPFLLSKLWYILPVPLHVGKSQLTKQEESLDAVKGNEMLTLTLEGVEIMLENEGAERFQLIPALSFNAKAVIQMFDWSSQLLINSEVYCEAAYFNQQLNVWEPILEPLEQPSGKLQQWRFEIEINRSAESYSSSPLHSMSTNSISTAANTNESLIPEPKFFISIEATDPLQITISRTSIQLIKNLVEAYTKEYGKKVEGSVSDRSLTGSPYTVINKLGPSTDLFLKPGNTLKLLGDKQFVKLGYMDYTDLFHVKNFAKVSMASLTVPSETQIIHLIDLSIGKSYQNITSIPIDTPGFQYYPLVAKQESLTPNAGIIVEVSATGAKKMIHVRSSVQVHNHLTTPIELFSILPKRDPQLLVHLEPNELFPVHFDVLYLAELSLRPPISGYPPSLPAFMWQSVNDKQRLDVYSMSEVDHTIFRVKVLVEEVVYKKKKGLPEGAFPHHIFHVYPISTVQNLLPVKIRMEPDDSSMTPVVLAPGEIRDLFYLVFTELSSLVVTLPTEDMEGMLKFPQVLTDIIDFTIGKGRDTLSLSILHEDVGYRRFSIYCPYWMVNKTGLTLSYKDDRSGRVYTQKPDQDIVLLSCDDKNDPKIKLSCYSIFNTKTEWSSAVSLQAIGTSGCVSSKLGDPCVYNFGVSVQLTKFTLSKMVVITPYYMIANNSSTDMVIIEERAPGEGTPISKGQLVPFWPQTDSSRLMIRIGSSKSVMFNYKTNDSLVLKLSDEPLVLCVDIQESDSSNVITISPYHESCVPVMFVNLLQDAIVTFSQDLKVTTPEYSLAPGESIYYTWDDPTDSRFIKWNIKRGKTDSKSLIDISKDEQVTFRYALEPGAAEESLKMSALTSIEGLNPQSSEDTWLSVDDSKEMSESLITIKREDNGAFNNNSNNHRIAHWKSFIDNLQRTVLFTNNSEILDRIKSADKLSQNIIEVDFSLKSAGLSLVDNKHKREVAYIGVTQSAVIWQVSRKKGHWKTLNNTVIALLEEAYQTNQIDIRTKELVVNVSEMEMYTPLRGKLRRTNYDGVHVKFGMSDKDYSLNARIGYIQIDNQLPFAVYPEVLYPLPPPPTVASTVEPKPFLEASIIVRKSENQHVNHFRYIHVLVQRIALNVDLGFILSLVDLFSLTEGDDVILEPEYVHKDIEYTHKDLAEIGLATTSDELKKRNFFDHFHIAPVKITLSFNVRSVGRNNADNTFGDRFLFLFLHSLGVLLSSVQEAEMNFSLFHLEYIILHWNSLINLLIQHYRTQGLVQIHRLILGLDVLGNPVKVVRGVVGGTFDLFYEPIKGSVLGPDEFAEGLGIGLMSFFGGTVGGLTGAGARITGAFGDVFAKLTFDDTFIDRRQQEKVKSSGLGSKVGGFFKNVAQGVTGVVVQPIKGVKEEGALGLLKGTGKGLVGLLVRPTGGLIDLTSGTLEFVTRKTRVGNIDIVQLRPARFISRDGIIHPYSPPKAVGNALLETTNEGHYTPKDCYVQHYQISDKPVKFLIVTDKRYMIIEERPLLDGWWVTLKLSFKHFTKEAVNAQNIVYMSVDNPSKYSRASQLSLSTEKMAEEICSLINEGYTIYKEDFSV